MDFDTYIRAADPGIRVSVEQPSDEMAALALHELATGAAGLRHPRRRVTLSLAIPGLGAIVIAIALLVVLLPSSASQHPSSAWRLVSTVSSTSFAPTPATPNVAATITCPSASVCYATGETQVLVAGTPEDAANAVYRSTNGGSSWQQLALPSGIILDTALTCPTVNQCLAGAWRGPGGYPTGTQAQLLISTTDEGRHWSIQSVPTPSFLAFHGYLRTLQCFSEEQCFGFGNEPNQKSEASPVFMATDDGGASWRTFVFPWVDAPGAAPAELESAVFDCADVESCQGIESVEYPMPSSIVGSVLTTRLLAWRTSDGGATWSDSWIEAGPGQAITVNCSDAIHCVATAYHGASGLVSTVGSDILTTVDGGAVWEVNVTPAGVNTLLETVSCSGADCWAGGYVANNSDPEADVGSVIQSDNYGSTWMPGSLPSHVGAVSDVYCPAGPVCFATAVEVSSAGLPVAEQVLTNQT